MANDCPTEKTESIMIRDTRQVAESYRQYLINNDLTNLKLPNVPNNANNAKHEIDNDHDGPTETTETVMIRYTNQVTNLKLHGCYSNAWMLQYLINIGFDEFKTAKCTTPRKHEIDKSIEYIDITSTFAIKQIPNKYHSNKISNCNKRISDCDYIIKLLNVLNQYVEFEYKILQSFIFDDIDIGCVVKWFLHAVTAHDSDDGFYYIYKKLSGSRCNMWVCNAFTRNHRNRTQNTNNLSDLYQVNDENTIVKMQILDKMHCHYIHCYDIGYRLTPQEKHNIFNDKNMNDEQQFTELAALTSNRRRIFETVYQTLGRVTSYSKFVTSVENRDDDMKADAVHNMQIYDFGFRFQYDGTMHGLQAKPKFQSIKEELTSNKPVILTMEAFSVELAKAEIYYNSYYCQKILITDDQPRYRLANSTHILAVLIYCNYDEFQCEFSKTYRDIHKDDTVKNIEDRHSQYYFLGKYLKGAVHLLGRHRSHLTFYHGVSQRLVFPINRNNDHFNIPLSTSTNFVVAASFATQGLIVEFGNYDKDSYSFSASWCSDYGNEDEHIFIQNRGSLKFQNIIDTQTGYQYRPMLRAMAVINRLCLGRKYNVETEQLFCRLVLHRSQKRLWKDLPIYAHHLLDQICLNQTSVDINWTHLSSEYPAIHQLFKAEKYDGINIKLLSALYPNLTHFCVWCMHLDPLFLDDLLDHLKINKMSKIRQMDFLPAYMTAKKNLEIYNMTKMYQNRFKQIGFRMKHSQNESLDPISKNTKLADSDLYPFLSSDRGNMFQLYRINSIPMPKRVMNSFYQSQVPLQQPY
eukprot:219675_1